MRTNPFTSPLALWASAYLGCTARLLLGLFPEGEISFALLGQLCWLAFIGSIPTVLVLGTASRVATSSNAVVFVSTLAVILVSAAIAWEHTDFLLSGPRWLLDEQRGIARIGMLAAVATACGGGWLWLLLGSRIKNRILLVAWLALTLAAVALLTSAIARYRAYDYSMAQLVFPAGVLCAAAVYRLLHQSRYRPLVLGAALSCLLCGAGSRFSPSMVATGRREVIAQSRAGALATLYVLPQFRTDDQWEMNGGVCPDRRPLLETSPLGIEPERRRNVIVITVDALRKDVIGSIVNGRAVTPALSSWAKTAVSFENATSTYPATLFAVGSAFTGLSPAEIYLSPSLPETIFTLTRALIDRQVAVLPDVDWFHLPIVGRFLAPGVETEFAPNDAAATDALISRLRSAREDGATVMAWIHFYSPHDPYVPQPEFTFGKGKRNAYLSEVAYFDQELGRLMEYLDQEHWLDDTLVVFFSDHGEALGERSYWGHHVYLNAWMIDVPLMLWHSELLPAEARVSVSLADVAPTVLHFLGLPLPSDIAAESLFTVDPKQVGRSTFSEAFPVRGRQLFESLRLPALDDATIHARLRSIRQSNEGYEPKGAITRDQYRLIHHRGADAVIFYDHGLDPNERSSQGAGSPEFAELLRSELERWEQEQLRRIRCRLQLSADPTATSHPR
jgi:hypothetical protein